MEPKKKKPRKTILEEDAYVGAMRAIIERDYYPELQAVREEEPLPMTLSEFGSKYTSEDNNSFEAQLAKDHRRHVRKYWWSYDRETLLDAGIDIPDASNLYTLSDGTRLSAERRRIADKALEPDAPRDGRDDEKISFAPHVPRSNFFFAPNHHVDQLTTTRTTANPLCIHSGLNKKTKTAIQHRNTRFNDDEDAKDDLRAPSESSGFPVLSEVSSFSAEDDFVPMTPILHPGTSSPIVTWGGLAAPPRVIDHEDLARALEQKSKQRKSRRRPTASTPFRSAVASASGTPALFGSAYTPHRRRPHPRGGGGGGGIKTPPR